MLAKPICNTGRRSFRTVKGLSWVAATSVGIADLDLLVERAFLGQRAFGIVAAIVCVVGTGRAKALLSRFDMVKIDALMPKRLQLCPTVRTSDFRRFNGLTTFRTGVHGDRKNPQRKIYFQHNLNSSSKVPVLPSNSSSDVELR